MSYVYHINTSYFIIKMKLIDNDVLQLNIIKTGNITSDWNESSSCNTCKHDFERDEKRVEWRLNTPGKTKYHCGSFWTIQCITCIQRTINEWSAALQSIPTFLPSPEA